MIHVIGLSDDTEAWDRFVEAAPGASFCHLAGWREVMDDVLGHECLYLVAVEESDTTAGVLPLVSVKSRVFGRYLVSMPFLNAGGPLGAPQARAALAERAREEAVRRGVRLLELRSRDGVAGFSLSRRKISVVLDLPPEPDALWGAFPSKLRSQIRRPQKEGLEARFGADQRDAFYAVFARNMRDLGMPVLPAALFARIAAVFPERVEFGAVWRGSEPVAAGCGFFWQYEFEITWASSLKEHSRSAPNMLLYWAFLERAIARGARRFDFGRCTPGGGTHRFKLQWGGRDVPLPWAQWSPQQGTATPSPERPLYRLAAACWSRLPLGVTNRVGPMLARQIP